MLAKYKKNMFITFRHDPRDLQTTVEQIRLDVRRGMNRLQLNNDTNNDAAQITMQLNELAVEEMSSKDIYKDQRAHYRSHERKIRDVIYANKCWKAICCNSHLFKDKIVLNVSCDVGILSMLSAIAGAKHVYAIDDSSIVQLTSRIIADNNLSDKITVIKGKVADITLPIGKVDVIVSNFFGHSLFIHNRLDELVDAREKWLASNGLIFPDRANYYIAALNNHLCLDRSNFWQHVYKLDMRPMIQAVNSEPYLQRVNISQIVTNACPIKQLNMYTVEKGDYKRFDAPFCLESGVNASIGAFLTYFDVQFTEGQKPITFTIQPGWPNTFWTPLIFFLSINDFQIDKNETFHGVFRMNAISDDYRKIDWNIEIMHQGNQCSFRDSWDFRTR